METSRAPVVTPAPAVEPPSPAALGASPAAGTSNASLLAALGLASSASMPPITELASLLPSLGAVGTVVLDALPPEAAVELASAHANLDWVSEWLGTADPVTGREACDAGTAVASPGQPATFAEAISTHARNVAMVQRVFASARSIVPDPEAGAESRPTLLHNSVEWLDEGEADCVILSLTHDTPKRGGPSDKLAYFDTRAAWGAAATYDPALGASGQAANAAGIEFQLDTVVGTMNGTTMKLYQPAAFTEALLVETLIHEVQHDADQHGSGEAWDEAAAPGITTDGSAPNAYFEAYRSEFRAYWMENPPGSVNDSFSAPDQRAVGQKAVAAKVNGALKTVTTSFLRQRQADIFAHLCGEAPPDLQWCNPQTGNFFGAYGYVPHFYVADPAFRAMVDETFDLDTGNAVNSVRIQALSNAIEACDEPGIEAAVADLDAVDRHALYDRGTSDPLWRRASEVLGATAAANLRATVETESVVDGGANAGTVAVQTGDTLTTLSARYLGGADRADELATLNHLPETSTNAPLVVGTRIHLPES